MQNKIILILLSPFAICAQNFNWTTRFGSTGDDRGTAICADSSGKLYTTGQFNGTVSIGGNTVVTAGGADIFVMKQSTTPQSFWTKRFGGTGNDYGRGIASANNTELYITGTFQNTAIFGNDTLTSSGSNDIFLSKLDSAGNCLWTKKAGGTSSEISYKVAIDKQNNVIICGSFYGSPAFSGSVITSAGSADIFVAKYNASGNLQWVQKAGGTGGDEAFAITTDKNNTIYITGSFAGTVAFGSSTLTSNGGADAFIASMDANGNFLWAQKGGGASFDWGGFGIGVDNASNVYATGSFFGPATFSSTTLPGNSWPAEIFLAKYNSSGAFQWAVQAGGANPDRAYNMAVDTLGNSFITGYYSQSAAFGAYSLTGNIEDIFVAKYNSSGIAQWAVKAGGNGFNEGNGICLLGSNVYLTGAFESTGTFGASTYTSSGSKDIFVSEIMNVPTLISESYENSLVIYPNPASQFIFLAGNFQNSDLKIFDTQGKLVKNENATGNGRVDISELKTGIYYLIINDDQRIYSSKISIIN